jgi:hypothetical protein
MVPRGVAALALQAAGPGGALAGRLTRGWRRQGVEMKTELAVGEPFLLASRAPLPSGGRPLAAVGSVLAQHP